MPAEHMYHVLEGPSPETEQRTEVCVFIYYMCIQRHLFVMCVITELATPTLGKQSVPVTQDIPLYSVVDLSKKKQNRDATIVSCCVALS